MKNARVREVQKKIVEAAIACIERDGLQGVTIRRIAQEAGVNSAAISYYFRSKDTLVTEALATTLENAFADWEMILRAKSSDLRPRIRSILIEVFEGSLRFPGIVKAHLYDTFVKGSARTAFIKRFSKFLSAMTAEMAIFFPDRSVHEIGRDTLQIVSAVLLPGIMPQLFQGAVEVDLSLPQGRAAYVDALIGRYFPVAPRAQTV